MHVQLGIGSGTVVYLVILRKRIACRKRKRWLQRFAQSGMAQNTRIKSLLARQGGGVYNKGSAFYLWVLGVKGHMLCSWSMATFAINTVNNLAVIKCSFNRCGMIRHCFGKRGMALQAAAVHHAVK